jgi:4-hydroxyphenylpyruvate dioxygenase
MEPAAREDLGEQPNPMGLEGIEFIEYGTTRPQALGQLLERIGFRLVGRHRSREILLYRQGGMNLVVNAHQVDGDGTPRLQAFALRVRDASKAFHAAVEKGAWPVAVEVAPMELHIPGVHGVGGSHIYFVDRWREFSIWDVDFVWAPNADRHPPATTGVQWFGLVQYINPWRMEAWCAFYQQLFGWTLIPQSQRFGILHQGEVLRSPCGFMLQLIEPSPDLLEDSEEYLARIAFATPNVMETAKAWQSNGVNFTENAKLHTETRGALTAHELGDVTFELVRALSAPQGV